MKLLLLVCLAAVAGATTPVYPPDQDIPLAYKCAYRKFAHEYGLRLRPDANQLMFDALNLGSLCGLDAEDAAGGIGIGIGEGVRGPLSEYNVEIRSAVPAASSIYVSPTGSDSNPGTADKPKQTIAAGLAATRGLPAPKSLLLFAGTYREASTLQLDARDSNLTITAVPGQEVWISGASELPKLTWTPYEDHPAGVKIFQNSNNAHGCAINATKGACTCTPAATLAVCEALFNASADLKSFTYQDHTTGGAWSLQCCVRNSTLWAPEPQNGHTSGKKFPAVHVYRSPLSVALFDQLRLNGGRIPRSRFPNADPERDIFPVGWCDDCGAHWIERPKRNDTVFVNVNNSLIDTRGTTDFSAYSGGIGGPCSVFDPPFSYWCSPNPTGGGGFQYYTPQGFSIDGVFPANWTAPSANKPVAQVWRRGHWASWMFEVDEIDAEGSSTTVTFGKGGFQGCRGGDGDEWFIENVKEFLDNPNEWYYDTKESMIYFFYNGTGAPPPDLVFEAPGLAVLFNATGSQGEPIKGLTISNIGFRDAAPTYLEPHAVPSGGDWGLERMAAIFFEGTEDLQVSNITVWRCDGNGLMLSGYNRDATIANSHFAYTGGSAIAFWGRTDELSNKGQNGWDARAGDFPWRTHAISNLIRETGIWEKQSSCIFQAKTAESTMIGNVCFNLARAGFNFNDGLGGGDQVHNNLIFNSCRESADHGPINSWDRQPYVTNVRGTASAHMYPRNISYNFLVANYGGTNGAVDNDDGSQMYHNNHNLQIYGHQKFKTGGIQSYGNVLLFVSGFGYHWKVPGTNKYSPNAMYNNTVLFLAADGRYHDCKPWHAHDNILYANKSVSIGCFAINYTLAEWQALNVSYNDVGSSFHAEFPSTDTMIGWGRTLLLG